MSLNLVNIQSGASEESAWAPDLVVTGPVLPKSMATVPSWISPEQAELIPTWSAEQQAQLVKAVEGTTPIGRELIQKSLHHLSKHPTASIDQALNDGHRLLNSQERQLLQEA